MESKGT